MPNTLISWIGNTDIAGRATHSGPLASILKFQPFSEVFLLHDQDENEVLELVDTLRDISEARFFPTSVQLESPVHYPDIYMALSELLSNPPGDASFFNLHINLSSGTPQMTAVSILMGKTKYPAQFLQSTKEQGVQLADIPFDIAADYIPAVSRALDVKLTELTASDAPEMVAFGSIVTQDPKMQLLKQKAAVLASREVPVLIFGESGTGKELFARAIHNASSRADHKFVPLNCGAIPPELIDSTLFGHKKGAFTGAATNQAGVFEQAQKGTLFLDEFGELPLDAQVRLLRVLEDGSYRPVGAESEKHADVRLIVATNQDLPKAISEGRFREDLFYRVAVGVLNLPPLREREGDRRLLADMFMQQINEEAKTQPGYKDKKISAGAKNLILNHTWPGNMRELRSTLLRASLWGKNEEITEAELREAMITPASAGDGVMDKDLSQGIDIQGIIGEIEAHYIKKALAITGGLKKDAAQLLGYNSYQNLDARIKKYGIEL